MRLKHKSNTKITIDNQIDYSNLTDKGGDETFLALWASILAKVPLVRNEKNLVKFTETLKNHSEPISHPDMLAIEAKTVKSFLKGYAFTPWSEFGPPKSSIFNQAVPIFLYAHKVYNNVPYGDWDKSDPNIDLALGYSFKGYRELVKDYDFSEVHQLYIEAEEPLTLEEARIKSVTSGDGLVHPFTSYKCNRIGITEFDQLPAFFRMMHFQTWKFNVEKRNKYMILNWNKWNNIPEPIDAVRDLTGIFE